MRLAIAATFVSVSCAAVGPVHKEYVERAWTRTAPPHPLANAPEAKPPRTTSIRLENGLRVVVVEQHRRPIVMVRLMFGSGAASDPKDAPGATFFAISLLGYGYEEDGDGNPIYDDDPFMRKVWDVGGRYSASVADDYATIGIDGYAIDTRLYADMLSAAVREPRHGPGAYSGLRSGIVHALEDIELEDDEALYRFLGRAGFGEGHPYARPTYGSVETLRSLGFWQVIERQRRLLDPRNSTLIIVGDVSPTKVLPAVRTAFERWRPRGAVRARTIKHPAIPKSPVPIVVPRPYMDTMALCALRPLSDIDGNDAALAVLAAVVGRPAGGRLFGSMRMQRGLAYSAYATIERRRHARVFVACASVPDKESEGGLAAFREVFAKMQKEAPLPEEVARAKAVLIAEIESQQDSVVGAMNAWVSALALGRSPDPRGRIAAIESVTADELFVLARQVFRARSIRLLIAGRTRAATMAMHAQGFRRVRQATLH